MLKAKAEVLAGNKKTKVLATGALVAGMMAARLIAASLAHASTTGLASVPWLSAVFGAAQCPLAHPI
jgi:hypothetical protein